MAEGRKYGRLQYGRYSYDLWPTWKPTPPNAPGDVWIPVPGFPPEESWISASADPPLADIWNPVSEPVNTWLSVTTAPSEIWVPVTTPRFE